MIVVQFNFFEEFLDELAHDDIKGEVVRVCVLQKRWPMGLIVGLTVLAGVMNLDGHLIELRQDCGGFDPHSEERQPAKERADLIVDKIRAAAKEHGFEVRSGRYLQAEQISK